MLAPKPALPKLSPALESKAPSSQSPRLPPQPADAPLHPQRESNKPDWDYVIPICLCSRAKCTCIRNSSVQVDKDLSVWHRCNGKTEGNEQLFSKSQRTFDSISTKLHKPLQEAVQAGRRLNADHSNGTGTPPVPHTTWTEEASADLEPQEEPGPGPEEDVLGSEQTSRPSKPVPVPRKLGTAGLTPQERVEEEGDEIPGRDGTELSVREVKVLLEGKSVSSPSAGAIPPPRKKPLLSEPGRTSTPGPHTLPKDGVEEDLGWDSSSQQMQVSLDKGGKVAGAREEREEREERDQEKVYTDITQKQTGSLQPPGSVQDGPRKAQQASSPMAWLGSAGGREPLTGLEKRQSPADGALKANVSRTFLTPAPVKPCQPSLSKHKSKSFSAADLVRSEGQRRNSFRKLLDLKLKMMPRLKGKADPIPGGAAPPAERSADGELLSCGQNLHPPVIRVEQSADADEDLYYENISVYEEISDYVNVEVGWAGRGAPSPGTPSGHGSLQPPAWTSPAYDDEGIYEEPDAYICLEKNHGPTSDCER